MRITPHHRTAALLLTAFAAATVSAANRRSPQASGLDSPPASPRSRSLHRLRHACDHHRQRGEAAIRSTILQP